MGTFWYVTFSSPDGWRSLNQFKRALQGMSSLLNLGGKIIDLPWTYSAQSLEWFTGKYLNSAGLPTPNPVVHQFISSMLGWWTHHWVLGSQSCLDHDTLCWNVMLLMLKTEILHQLRCTKPSKSWDKLPSSAGARFLPSTITYTQSIHSQNMSPPLFRHRESPFT